MADIYVDPSSATNGSGSFADPRNIWPTSISTNDRILLKRGTRLVSTSQIGNGAGNTVLITNYGDGSAPLPIITLITPGNTGCFNASATGILTFDGVHFDACVSNTNGGALNSAGTPGTNLVVQNCRFTNINYNAIRLQATGANSAATFACYNNWFENIGEDAIFGGAFDYRVGNNIMINLSTNTDTGDGVGFINTDPTFVWIFNNYIDHSNKDVKQCVVVDSSTGAGLTILENNYLIGYGNALNPALVHTPFIIDNKAIIRGNYIRCGGLAGGSSVANTSITGNIIDIQNVNPTTCILSMGASNTNVDNNTFIGRGQLNSATTIVQQNPSLSSCTVRNNIFYNVPIAIKSLTVGNNPTATNNGFYNVISQRLDSTNTPFAGGNDVTSDPNFTSGFIPQTAAYQTGGLVLGGTDWYKYGFENTIGAVQYHAARTQSFAPTQDFTKTQSFSPTQRTF